MNALKVTVDLDSTAVHGQCFRPCLHGDDTTQYDTVRLQKPPDTERLQGLDANKYVVHILGLYVALYYTLTY